VSSNYPLPTFHYPLTSGKCFHKQAIAYAEIVEALMGIIGKHAQK